MPKDKQEWLAPGGRGRAAPQPEGPKPVLFAPGALYGYCPRCGAPGVRRKSGGKDGDTCQAGHSYPSLEALVRPDPKMKVRR